MAQVKFMLIVVVLILGWRAAMKGRKWTAGEGGSGNKLTRSDVKYLALGDSYTIGESVRPEERYPEQVRRILAEKDHLDCGDPEIIAVTGWTTGNLLEALADAKIGEGGGPTYDAVSLLIGVNNQYQGRSLAEYRLQFGELLRKSIRLADNRPSHVLVLSIPDYSVTPFARAQGRDTTLIAAQIDLFNRINHELAQQYGVTYIDVTSESRKAGMNASLIAADGLHFSGEEYNAWARLMEPVLKEILKAGH
jgi:lysophospholipase L1-like esterase